MVLHLLFFSSVLFASTKEETPLRSVTHGFLGSCILSRGGQQGRTGKQREEDSDHELLLGVLLCLIN